MPGQVESHYSGAGSLSDSIAEKLITAGKRVDELTTADLATVDEFHIRGRQATLQLAERMNLSPATEVLDIGSGLGGPARTLAETYGCTVTGIDLTEAFCDAAAVLSGWVGLHERVSFIHGDATDLPFDDNRFDAAMTIHVAMNILAKDRVYAGAKRVVKPGGIFAVYDVLQGEGGDVQFPVPWAREPSISHLATPPEMERLLTEAGFTIVDSQDSTEAAQAWFEAMAERMVNTGPPPVSFQTFLGEDYVQMVRNQVLNLAERRIRTVTYICEG